MYTALLFDLDGTLTDSAPGIINSFRYSMEKMNIPVDESTINEIIGPPLLESYKRLYGLDTETGKVALGHYREYFKGGGMFENSVYEGIPKTLEILKAQGKRLFVATAKPEVFSKQILEHFGLADYFEFIGGASLDESRNTKAKVIKYVIESNGLKKEDTVMIGDRYNDIEGANEIGIDSIGVLFGYGDEAELKGAGATYIARTPEDICGLV